MTTRLDDSALLARLVGFDSVSRNSNLPIADFICDYLDRPEIRIDRFLTPEGDKVNLAVWLGPPADPETRDGLVLSGHVDVVPADEPGWESNPFELRDGGDRLVGRGACDMKGFVALAINLAAEVDVSRLKKPLVLLLTHDEEVGTVGARHLSRAWPRERTLPSATVVGEPTSLGVVRMHKGHASLRLTIHGVGAHSGYPHLGENAIEPMGRAILALSQLREELAQERPDHHQHFPEVPFVALNAGRIYGGAAINIVPDSCALEVGFRVLPGMEAESIRQRLGDAFAETLTPLGARFEIDEINESPPLLLAEDNSFYRYLCELAGQRETISASYATDAGWLQTLDLDCALFGPGSIEVAHKPNEHIPKAELHSAARLLRTMVHDRCLS